MHLPISNVDKYNQHQLLGLCKTACLVGPFHAHQTVAYYYDYLTPGFMASYLMFISAANPKRVRGLCQKQHGPFYPGKTQAPSHTDLAEPLKCCFLQAEGPPNHPPPSIGATKMSKINVAAVPESAKTSMPPPASPSPEKQEKSKQTDQTLLKCKVSYLGLY